MQGGWISGSKGSCSHSGCGIFTSEPSTSSCLGEKLDIPQERLGGMRVGRSLFFFFFFAKVFSPLLLRDPTLRPGAFEVTQLHRRLSPDLIRQQGRWKLALGINQGPSLGDGGMSNNLPEGKEPHFPEIFLNLPHVCSQVRMPNLPLV